MICSHKTNLIPHRDYNNYLPLIHILLYIGRLIHKETLNLRGVRRVLQRFLHCLHHTDSHWNLPLSTSQSLSFHWPCFSGRIPSSGRGPVLLKVEIIQIRILHFLTHHGVQRGIVIGLNTPSSHREEGRGVVRKYAQACFLSLYYTTLNGSCGHTVSA